MIQDSPAPPFPPPPLDEGALCFTFDQKWLPFLLPAVQELLNPDVWLSNAEYAIDEVSLLIKALVSGGECVTPFVMPAGSIVEYPAAAAPADWLLCDGSAVSRATYAALFAVIGTTYGVGNGTTTFNVPDFRGRVPMGAGQGTGLSNRALAAQVGEETHQLTAAELAAHTHTGPSHTHAGPSHTHAGPDHTHTGPSHTHTGPDHTHTGPSHTHTETQHTHTGPDHTHTGPVHNHTGALHTHPMPHKHLLERYTGGTGGINIPAPGTAANTATDMTVFTKDTSTANTDTNSASNTGSAGAGATGSGGTGATGSNAASSTGASGTAVTGSAGTGATGASGTAATGSGGTGDTAASGTAATGASGTGATGSAGSDNGHNNMQPSLVVNFIIKT